ncbi:hypothetical protein [uncultured Flavobacterium sp.]|uniref:hypothetical protein n=1 Tax=uncultured Flavobacterium sp. TaxID=165435 RepID=UPI0025CC8EAB|nr:hypothetical protein [uncultured Flavobacterium sp.]
MLKQAVKNFLKKHFYILKVREKFTPAVQIGQVQLFHYYQDCKRNNTLPALKDTGFKVFSQFEEDGKLLFIFSVIGMESKIFVDIGSNDGVNSNCANFLINFGWHGLFIDSDASVLEIGKKFYSKYPDPWGFPPKFLCKKVTRENLNESIQNAGFEGEIDLLSIDLDGYDYWIWDTLEIVKPRVVIVETQVEFGLKDLVSPYEKNISEQIKYQGASPVAYVKLAKKKGYRLVGANDYGHNMIFIKNGVGEEFIPEVSVESILNHPFAKQKIKEFESLMK